MARMHRKKNHFLDIDIPANGEIIQLLYQEARDSNSPLAKMERWNIEKLLGRVVDENSPATFQEMLPLWIGKGGCIELNQNKLQNYRTFLGKHNKCTEFDKLFSRREKRFGKCLDAEPGVIQDFIFLNEFISNTGNGKKTSSPTILELGGGFGILAEEVFSNWGHGVTYVLSDAVPESLWYQYSYLKEEFPNLRVGASFNGDVFKENLYDIYILPAWLIEGSLLENSFDAIVNIASMQEMPNEAVSAYLEIIPKLLKDEGIFLFENSREFCGGREYSFLSQWSYLLKEHTPRSRSFDYPLDILAKKEGSNDASCCTSESLIEVYYKLLKQRLITIIKDRDKELFEASNIIKSLNCKVKNLSQALKSSNQLTSELKQKATKYEMLEPELTSLRQDANRYRNIAEQLPELKQKAAKYKKLEPELTSLRQDANRYRNIAEQLPELKQKAAKYEKLELSTLTEEKQTTNKHERKGD